VFEARLEETRLVRVEAHEQGDHEAEEKARERIETLLTGHAAWADAKRVRDSNLCVCGHGRGDHVQGWPEACAVINCICYKFDPTPEAVT